MPRAPTSESIEPFRLRLGLPKGRMYAAVGALLADAGLPLRGGDRDYRPRLQLPGFEVKVQKPQNIVEMLHSGSRDLGFAGADWVQELEVDVVEVLDTGLDPVRLVAAAPRPLLCDGGLPDRPLLVASEYEQLTRRWIAARGLQATFVRSYGATEVFPPEDADVIVDNCATGATLQQNGLAVVEELAQSTTRLYASRAAMRDPGRRAGIDSFALLCRSVLEARSRAMLELNVRSADLDAVLAVLPSMQRPTIAELAGDGGFAVRAAVPRAELPQLIVQLRARGGRDLVVTKPMQIVP